MTIDLFRDKTKVTIVGGGTVGYRVFQTLMLQPDIEVLGITKRNLDDADGRYLEKNYPDHTFPLPLLDTLLELSDVVVDCTDKAAHTNMPKYQEHNLKVVIQGGEQKGLADTFFNSYYNFHEAKQSGVVQVNSCNNTNYLRLVYAMRELPLIPVSIWSLCRRAADPKQSRKGPINAVESATDTHHAGDIMKTLAGASIISNAYKGPFTEMHCQTPVFFAEKPVTVDEVVASLESVPRIITLDKKAFPTTAQIREYGRKLAVIPGRFGDIYESVVWKDEVSVNQVDILGNPVYMISVPTAVHQEAIVIPDNIDAVKALSGSCCRQSIPYTDFSLGIGKGW